MSDIEEEKIPKYPKLRHLGHRDTIGIFDSPVVIQEKVDGSQISFGIVEGEVFVRSKNTHRDLDEDGMFSKGIAEILGRKDHLIEGRVYRGEYLQSSQHNLIKYGRIPRGHIVLFGYHYRDEVDGIRGVAPIAETLGFDECPVLHEGMIDSREQVDALMEGESFLGGMMEGVVIKNYSTGQFAKVVNEKFAEKHHRNRSEKKARGGVDAIIATYRNHNRWWKAVQHLREDNNLHGEPRDIGPLIKEIQADVMEECGDDIKDALFKEHRKAIFNGIISGFPEWYKELISADPFKVDGENQ